MDEIMHRGYTVRMEEILKHSPWEYNISMLAEKQDSGHTVTDGPHLIYFTTNDQISHDIVISPASNQDR